MPRISRRKRKYNLFKRFYSGSVHDNRLWCNTDQFLQYNNFFSRFQYLLADSAFATGVHLITACFKIKNCLTRTWQRLGLKWSTVLVF